MASPSPGRSERAGDERAYAGIGSHPPPAALELICELAATFACEGWILRTGLSPGADQAFYTGARARAGAVELYLPWPGFQAHARDPQEGDEVREHARATPAAHVLARRFYRSFDGRSWESLDAAEHALLARDVHQVLGADLHAPAARVVCWTECGGLDGTDPRAEGTAQALRVAHAHGVGVFNLARPVHARRLRERGLPREPPAT